MAIDTNIFDSSQSTVTDVTLKPNITLESCGKKFEFTELTGVYTATNTGGWGLPTNTDITTADLANIRLTSPSGVVTDIDVTPSGFPSVLGVSHTITTADLGSTSIEDGIWTILYGVRITGGTYLVPMQIKVFVTTAIQCCVDKAFAAISADDCTCDPDKIDRALLASAYLKAACVAANCGQSDKAASLLKAAEKLCNNTNCSNC